MAIAEQQSDPEVPLQEKLESTVFAFRGFNVTNQGRTRELLHHGAYGPIVKKHLQHVSEICSHCISEEVDLVALVENQVTETLDIYPQSLSMVIGIELAQLEILESLFGIEYKQAQLSCGYSLGEATAVIAGGIFSLETVLTPLLTLAHDAADLAHDVTMGILFSRGPALDFDKVERLCLELTSEGQGTVAISSYLSPNTALLLGQADTIDRFKVAMKDVFEKKVHLRKNPNHWPPLHTPLTWQKNIPNQVGVILASSPGGFTVPQPPILSCVTGDMAYTETNSRDILTRWVDHPQKLWDVVENMLADGVEHVIHVGPEPNIIPATFDRLNNNIAAQLDSGTLTSLGLRAISQIVRRRPWLTSLIKSDATLLRAPFVEQIILEDWLLEQDIN